MPTVDCPHCGETTLYDADKDIQDVQIVEDANGERVAIFKVRCCKCGALVPAGGRDGRGNV